MKRIILIVAFMLTFSGAVFAQLIKYSDIPKELRALGFITNIDPSYASLPRIAYLNYKDAISGKYQGKNNLFLGITVFQINKQDDGSYAYSGYSGIGDEVDWHAIIMVIAKDRVRNLAIGHPGLFLCHYRNTIGLTLTDNNTAAETDIQVPVFVSDLAGTYFAKDQ